jgi:hypothetical protein
MSFDAVGVVVMISGPGDTSDEVKVVREVIAKWNSDHAANQGVVFIPKHFSTNTVPVYRRDIDGQAVINEQITKHSDVVLCLFKYRLGTETPRNEHSGTVEEAELRESAAQVHMYFWDGDSVPRSVTDDPKARDQWDRLQAYRASFLNNDKGLYASYRSDSDLHEQVDRALWADAQVFGKNSTPGPVAEPLAATALDITIGGQVWHSPTFDKHLEQFIDGDIKQEQEWADKFRKSVPSSADLIANAMPGHSRPRTPKTEDDIEAWANSLRSRIDKFDNSIAAAAGTPIKIELNSDVLLQGVEVEVVFSGVRGIDPTDESWDDVWTPLHVPASPFGIDAFRPAMPDLRGTGSTSSDWTQSGDDLILTIQLDVLRKRTVPVVIDDSVILMLPWTSDAPSEISCTWRATAVGTTQEWAGKGTVPVLTEWREAMVTWFRSQIAERNR